VLKTSRACAFYICDVFQRLSILCDAIMHFYLVIYILLLSYLTLNLLFLVLYLKIVPQKLNVILFFDRIF
jgi:hypothetical protein